MGERLSRPIDQDILGRVLDRYLGEQTEEGGEPLGVEGTQRLDLS